MPNHQAGQRAIRSFVGELISDFIVHVDGSNFLGEFEGQEKGLARRSDPATNRIVGIVEKELGKDRDIEADAAPALTPGSSIAIPRGAYSVQKADISPD